MCVSEGQLRSGTVERKGCNGLDMCRVGRVDILDKGCGGWMKKRMTTRKINAGSEERHAEGWCGKRRHWG